MGKKYLVIDAHNHIGNAVGTTVENFSAEDLLKYMNESNQDMAVIFGPVINAEYKWRYNYYASNDYIADMQKKYPSRFIGLATLNPWYQNNEVLNSLGRKDLKFIENATINEIDRCVFDLGLRGFKFHPYFHGYSFNDPILMPPIFDKILEVQKKIGKPLYNVLHLWAVDSFCSVEKLAMVAESYPELNFAAAHCGDGSEVKTMIKIAKKYNNIILDLTYTTNPIRKLKEFIDEIDITRIVAGSDQYTTRFNTYGWKMEIVNLAVCSEENKNLILGGNLQNFFKIK